MATLHVPTDFPAVAGKYIVLTGGSSGIGLATAQLLTSQGANLLIADPQPPPSSASLPTSNTHYHHTDVTSWSSLLSLFTHALEIFPYIDTFIANAGIGEIEDIFLSTISPDTGLLAEPTYKVLDVNLKGVFSCAKLAVHHFRESGRGGRLVITASTAGYMGEMCLPVYSAAKHGLVGLMRSIAPTASKFGIEVNCVAPWFTDTHLIYKELREVLNGAGIPIQNANSVARAMAFAACGGPATGGQTKEKTAAKLDEDISQRQATSDDLSSPHPPKQAPGPESERKTALWTGRTIYVANDTFTELEGTIISLEPQWLGAENAANFRKAQGVGYFTSESEM